MRLKSLKLAGFKSFANPTTFSFKHDITAIVGPNGCGKSNVIDAIRWVLGESSAKQLRGGAMSDVIFAGTDGRAAKSMASVELTFEHTQDETKGIRHALNLYHELTLRRQVSLDGKSDYFINGQRVRRRDVVDVFLGTGLGARSYAVIEQGMIGRIIDADGQRLREFIEEAAGVSRYQARRDETEKQLKKAKENLERLNDLQSELAKQHKTLKRQAESAKRHQELQNKLSAVEVDILTHRLYSAWQQHESRQNAHQHLESKLITLNQTMANLRTRQDSLMGKLAEIQWQRDDARTRAHQADLAYQSAKHALDNAILAQAQAMEAQTKLATDNQALTDDDTKQRQAIATHQQALNTLVPKLAALEADHSQHQHEQLSLNQDWQSQRQTLSQLHNERQQHQNTLNLSTNAIQRLKQQQARWAQKYSAHEAQAAKTAAMPIDAAQVPALRARIKSLDAQISECHTRMADTQHKLSTLSQALDGSRHHITELDKQHSRLSSEYDTLHKLVYPPKPKPDQIKDGGSPEVPLLQPASLADNLTLTEQGKHHADILDKLLAALLCDGALPADASSAQAILCTHLSRIPVANNAKKALWLSAPSGSTQQNTDTETLIPLSQLISTPRLSLWQALYLTTDETACRSVDWTHPAYAAIAAIVTPSGWLIHRLGAWHLSKLGGDAAAGFLLQRQAHLLRLAELEDALSDLEEQMHTCQQAHKIKQGEYDSLTLALEEYNAQINTMRHQQQNTERQLIQIESAQALAEHSQAQLAQNLALLMSEKEELASDVQSLEREQSQAHDALELLLPTLNQQKSLLDALTHSQEMLATRSHKLQAEIQQLTLTLKSHEQALSHAQARQEELAIRQLRLNDEHDRLNALLTTLNTQLPTLHTDANTAAETARSCQLAYEEYDVLLNNFTHEHNEIQAQRTDTQDAIDAMLSNQARLGAEVAVALARMQEVGLRLGERVAGFNLASCLSDFAHANFQPPDNIEALTHSQKQLSAELGKLGAVNLAAAAELTELEARLTPMMTEISDVEASIVTLQQAIDTINQKTKTLFLATLQAVNAELDHLFAKIFGGGQASLTLMPDEQLARADKWRAGLVLMAQPKGKKNSRLAVLSGGEKTLTALSLIFAIFKQNPAPFCVLDEVDAPLDDANVARFTGLIEELAREVQFIFISHNKLAMQSAQELKGVTMPSAGISALVSVSLAEAAQMVA